MSKWKWVAAVCLFEVMIIAFAAGVFGAPAPFTCEQVQLFVHGKTHDQLQAVLAGMNPHERAAAAQCLQKPKVKSHTVQPVPVQPVQPVQPAVVPIAQPAPVVVVTPFVCTHQQAEAGECSPQTEAVTPAPKPKKQKGSLMKLIEIILIAGGGVVAYLVMKFGIVAVVQKVLTWWNARKLVPTTQMLLDAHAAFEARLVELEDRFKPASSVGGPEPPAATVTINEAAHGDAPAEPAKV